MINPASINHDDARWRWHDEQLVHADYQPQSVTRRPNSRLQKWIVDHVYASQRQSPQVEACLQELLGGLGTSEWGLNLGAGDTQLHERVLNLDIHDAPHMNIINEGTELPFADNSLDLVISQEVLEHIADPISHDRRSIARFAARRKFLLSGAVSNRFSSRALRLLEILAPGV